MFLAIKSLMGQRVEQPVSIKQCQKLIKLLSIKLYCYILDLIVTFLKHVMFKLINAKSTHTTSAYSKETVH